MNWSLPVFVLLVVAQSTLGKPTMKCGEPADIVFVLDSSSSIWPPDFVKQLEFVENIVEDFDVGPGVFQTRVGVVTFSDDHYLQFDLNQYNDKSSVISAIRHISYSSGGTNTGVAIDYMSKVMFAAHGRKNVSHIAVVITDGMSQEREITDQTAKEAKKGGIQIFAIGVGNGVDKEELGTIASEPKGKFMFQVLSYAALQTIKQTLAVRACEVTQAPTTVKPTTPMPTEPMEKTTTLRPDQIQADREKLTTSCGGKPADVYFLLDSSSSILPIDYMKQLKFVRDVVDNFDIGPQKTRVGVSTFSDTYQPFFALDKYDDKEAMKVAVKKVPYLTGGTNTAEAIRRARTEGFAPDMARRDVGHVMIVLTDGLSQTPEETAMEARLAKKAGIYVFAIGIGGNIDHNELKEIASEPDSRYLFHVTSFDALESIKDILAISACEVGPIVGEQPIKCGTGAGTDVLFAFDSSHMGNERSQMTLQFIRKVSESIGDRPSIRMGIMSNNCPVGGDISLQSRSLNANLDQLMTKGYMGLGSVIRKARLQGFSSANGGRGDANHVTVLFVDGEIDAEALRETKRARFQDTEIFVIAIGDQVDLQQAKALCGRNSNTNILVVPDYSHLISLAEAFEQQLCEAL